MALLLEHLKASRGHFRLESGFHSDLWITLDALFVEPARIAPLIVALAGRLRPYAVDAICGPLVGGAFLAQALAQELKVRFYFATHEPPVPTGDLFSARYRLPSGLNGRIFGERIAVVDDVISAGSAVRATTDAVASARASTVVVGAFVVLGKTAVAHFARERMPVEALEFDEFNLWAPDDCPLCRARVPLEDRGHEG
jgi:orotate phosphoribosyltransferase